jgi:pyruvate/2-oxoglutarate dehydrogenase complex dihydrolipoamide acyltransferase (E2) component
MQNVTLDKLSEDVTEATIQHWLREEGDYVEEGDDLVRVKTEDGSFTIAAPAAGTLNELFFEEGEVVTVGDVICEIDTD